MVRFNCPSCNKLYSFKALPIPESGAEFLCARCNSKCMLREHHGKLEVTLISSSEAEEDNISQQVFDSYRPQEADVFTPEQIERQLQGMITELPIGNDYVVGVMEGPDQGSMFRVENAVVVIGKSGCDINLQDTNISREHCRIEIYGHQLIVLRDLDSTWGTFKNGTQISVSTLSAGDKIQVGKTTLSLILSGTR